MSSLEGSLEKRFETFVTRIDEEIAYMGDELSRAEQEIREDASAATEIEQLVIVTFGCRKIMILNCVNIDIMQHSSTLPAAWHFVNVGLTSTLHKQT